MELKTRILKWSAGVPVAMLNQETAEKLGVHLHDRISIKTSTKELATIIDTVGNLVGKNEIAVSSEIKHRLNLKNHQRVNVNISIAPESLSFIKEKLNNKVLSEKKIKTIIKNVVDNSLSEAEIALFVSAAYKNGMNFKETIYLIKAFLETGKILDLGRKNIADKHSIGGIPGNRTTPLVVSICAAAGLTMPKTSSRAITSPAGTADVIETISPVEFTIKQLKKIIHKTNACMIWGGGLGTVPADSKIIQIEKQLQLDPESQLLASIFSKKLAVKSKYILIDIPYGKNAKVTKQKALHLKKKFLQIGKYFNKKIKVLLTEGEQPIGNGIGPALELLDILKILNPKEQGPKDLQEKALFLSGELLELAGKTKKGQGRKLAEQILFSGKAFEKFKQIIKAQNGDLKKLNPLSLGKYSKVILSKKSGTILEIHNKKITSLAISAGCPLDKFSGIYLYKHKDEKIQKGEPLIKIYAESHSRLKQAIQTYKKQNPFTIK